jgi:hypothetical protein
LVCEEVRRVRNKPRVREKVEAVYHCEGERFLHLSSSLPHPILAPHRKVGSKSQIPTNTHVPSSPSNSMNKTNISSV